MKKSLLLFCIYTFQVLSAQNPLAIKYYNEGVKLYGKNNFLEADSLFTLSLKHGSTKESFYGRALCRNQLNNYSGYCADLAQASNLGENKATERYLNGCGRIDTTYKKLEQNFTGIPIYSRSINYLGDNGINHGFVQKYSDQYGPLKQVAAAQKDSIEKLSLVEKAAEFPGGTGAMMKFINENR